MIRKRKVQKGKSLTYGNVAVKMVCDENISIVEITDDTICSTIGTNLPCHELNNVVEMKVSCILSTKGVMKKNGPLRSVETKNGTKNVINFTIMSGDRDIEVTAWGDKADAMAGQPLEKGYTIHYL